MSINYVRLLQRVRDEHDVVDASLIYVREQWLRQNLSLAIRTATPEDLRRAVDDLDATYFIRLFSTFEGILKQHLAQHHPDLALEEDARAVVLIDRVAQLQHPQLSAPLRERVHEVRRYRNHLIHSGGGTPPVVLFVDALARLSKFVSHLPEPR